MPYAAPTHQQPISKAGKRNYDRVLDKRRGNAQSRGYNWRWQKARLAHLGKHPLCIECSTLGRVTAASVVDHIVPHRGDQELFWDLSNWQSLCAPCHNRKTGRGA